MMRVGRCCMRHDAMLSRRALRLMHLNAPICQIEEAAFPAESWATPNFDGFEILQVLMLLLRSFLPACGGHPWLFSPEYGPAPPIDGLQEGLYLDLRHRAALDCIGRHRMGHLDPPPTSVVIGGHFNAIDADGAKMLYLTLPC